MSDRITAENVAVQVKTETVAKMKKAVVKKDSVKEVVVEAVADNKEMPTNFSREEIMQYVKGQPNYMLEVLMKDQKYGFNIPREKIGKEIDVQINGMLFTIPTGEYLFLPKKIVDLVMNYVETLNRAGAEKRISRDSAIENALN